MLFIGGERIGFADDGDRKAAFGTGTTDHA
jgi:hypothetical protein